MGKKGAETLRRLYGDDYFKQIGSKGGQHAKYAGADYKELGKKAGATTLARYGRVHFQRCRLGLKSKPESAPDGE